jgi:hypothetical protein
MEVAVLWDAAQCSLTEIDRSFRDIASIISLMMEKLTLLKCRSISTELYGATYL